MEHIYNYSTNDILIALTKPMFDYEDQLSRDMRTFTVENSVKENHGYEYRGVKFEPKFTRGAIYTLMPDGLKPEADEFIEQRVKVVEDALNVKTYLKRVKTDIPSELGELIGFYSTLAHVDEEAQAIMDSYKAYKFMLMITKDEE